MWSLSAIALVAVSSALIVQPIGWTQTSYYALLKAFAHGTATIDPYNWETGDDAWFDDHYYSTKPPGLAFLSFPFFALLRAVDLAPVNALQDIFDQSLATWGIPPLAVWPLTLFGAVLPAALLMLLVRRLGNTLEPGLGIAAAITLGLGTLVLPFSTLYFGHLLAAALGFAAFALLWTERDGRPRLGYLAGAGFLAGYAITSEYPYALLAIALGLYAVARGDVLRRGLAYSLGALGGVAPSLAYNKLAFGSFTHLSYENAISNPGNSGHDQIGLNADGFFGVTTPNPHVALELLFQSKGLLTLSPVLAVGALGLVLLYRRGRRLEALLIAAIALAYLVYNSGYWLPFGGGTPGPRFLIPIVPFLALPLVLAYRRFPELTAALALASILAMLTATVTPSTIIADQETGVWLTRIGRGDLNYTVFTYLFGWHGWLGFWPYLLLLVVACACAVRALPVARPSRRGAEIALVALAAWGLVASAGPTLLDVDETASKGLGAAALCLIVIATALAVAAVSSRGLRALWLPGPIVLAAGLLDGSETIAVTLAAVAAVAAATAFRPSLLPRPSPSR